MSLSRIKILSKAFRSFGGELARFGVVGALATAVHYTVALSANAYVVALVANVLGYLAALSVSYVGHQRWTFRLAAEAIDHRRQLPRFAVTSLSALALSQGAVAATQFIGVADAGALAAGVVVVPVWTFLLGRFWVFARVPDDAA